VSYYPIITAPYCRGKTILYNFSPNNWESADRFNQHINLTYIEDGLWHSKTMGRIDYDSYKEFTYNDIVSLIPDGALALFSVTKNKLPEASEVLPVLTKNHTYMPMHRATLGLESEYTTTSYQGELDPFPIQASLLTFSPFMQFGEGIENYVLLINLEKIPKKREVEIEIYDARSKKLKKVQNVCSNQVNVVSLDDAGFNRESLPVVICRGMAFIPLYFSSYNQGELLSLEHSHPPASLVVHGNRFGAQKQLKNYWLSQLKK
jgi:hypothetical protein